MPVISGHRNLASIPEEHITDKITRKVISGKQGMMVWWRFEAGGHAAAHKHPHEQISWMIKGRMDLRIGDEKRSMVAGDIAVIPGGVEHEAFFPEETEIVDFFAPVRADFLAGGTPAYMKQA
jgi:quercetin dioxygenase-like cupin family protein